MALIKTYNNGMIEAKVSKEYEHTYNLPLCKHCNHLPVLYCIDHDDNMTHTYSIRCSNTECHEHDQVLLLDDIKQAQKEWINLNLKPCFRCHGKIVAIEINSNLKSVKEQVHLNCLQCGWLFSPPVMLSIINLAEEWNKHRG